MNNLSVVLPKLFSDLLINLSAGFLGAAVIVPVNIKNFSRISFSLLLINIVISCFLFALAVILNI